jgi:hypothetical protein
MEDYEDNAFYAFALEHCPDLIALCVSKHYILCLPVNWNSQRQNRAHVEAHILQPSPYFSHEYIALNGFKFSVDGNTLKGESLVEQPSLECKILGQDVCYVETANFPIWLISRPLLASASEDTSNTIDILECPMEFTAFVVSYFP